MSQAGRVKLRVEVDSASGDPPSWQAQRACEAVDAVEPKATVGSKLKGQRAGNLNSGGQKGASGIKLPTIKPVRYELGPEAKRVLRLLNIVQPDGSDTALTPEASRSSPAALKAPASSTGLLTHRSSAGGALTSRRNSPHVSSPGAVKADTVSFLRGSPSNTGNASPKLRLPSGLALTVTIPSANGVQEQLNAASPSGLYITGPQDDITLSSPGVRPEGGSESDADDGVLPTLHGNDDDELTGRLLSLPNIMCHAANGDVFLVGLGDVQTMLHKRRLGSKGLAVLRRFENATMSQWDAARERSTDTYALKWRQKHEAQLTARATKHMSMTADPLGPSVEGSVSQWNPRMTSSGEGESPHHGLSVQLAEQVAAHVAASMAMVEAHRNHLTENSARTLAELARQEAFEAAENRKAQAVDFVVKHLIPEKILGMANARRTKHAAGNELFRRMKNSLQPSFHPPGTADSEASPRVGGARNWGKLKARTDDMMTNMPFLHEWNTAISKLKKSDPAKGWDELLVADNVYVKGGAGDGQGAAVYIYNCQQLGVVPSTQVVQQLRCPEANMAHCKLGSRGAKALRFALATNTTITALDLTDNQLDAQGAGEIIAGLTFGQMAHVAPVQRKVLQDKWKQLDWVKAFKKPTEDAGTLSMAEMVRKVSSTEVPDEQTLKAQSQGQGIKHPAQATTLRPETAELQDSKDKLAVRVMDADVDNAAGNSRPGSQRVTDINVHSRRRSSNGKRVSTSGSSNVPAGLLHSLLSRVVVLDLSENPLGVNGAKAMAALLDPSRTLTQFLQELYLNKCGIQETGGIAIFQALANGNDVLRVLGLANNACGNASARTIGDLLTTNTSLQDLNLSWNQIKPDGAHEICRGLDVNTTLLRLNLSWNGLENEGVVRIGQSLMVNKGLQYLELTNTRMGSDACLMLGEGIKANTCLEELILNGNSVGDDGARHLMAALKANNTLQYLGLQGSNMSSAARGQHGATDFNPLAPDGSYSLQLESPADRAVALQLCGLEVAGKGDLMRNVKIDGRNITSVKGMRWPDQLPVTGMLTFDFVSRRTQKALQVMDHKKFQALVGQLDSNTMPDKEKLALVDVMAPFSYFYCHQIAQVLRCFSMGEELVRAAALLFTRSADLEESTSEITAAMQERDIHALHNLLGWYSFFRFSNCTGHYELNLTTPVHQALACRLKDVAYGEPSDGNNWINIIHDLYSTATKVAMSYGPPEVWKGGVPQRGSLAVDFVSQVVLPDNTQPISDEQLIDFLHHSIGIQFTDQGTPIPESDMAEADMQAALLRQEVSHQLYFTCSQVLRCMACFTTGIHKVEVAVMLWALTVDKKNWWTVMYSLRAFEQGLLMWRLGPANVFDKSHPSGHYILDLANHSHEQVARRLVDLAAQNPELPNFWNIRLQGIKKNVFENRNMWGTFTAESFTPFLEFDYIGPDAPECLLNKSRSDWEAWTKGDRLDAVTRQAKRMEIQRIKDMYGYFNDGSGWSGPSWATANQMFKPLLNKTPWLAAWDRLMRLLVRFDMRSGDITTGSHIEDIYDSHSREDNNISNDTFEAVCKEWGYSKAEIVMHYRPLFESAAQPLYANTKDTNTVRNSSEQLTAGIAAQPQSDTPDLPTMVVDFPTFVEIFMREPPADMRFKEVQHNAFNAMAAAAKAVKNIRKAVNLVSKK